MPRVCAITGAKTRSGHRITRRGKAKHLGGVGIKTTSVTKRTFSPNLQTVRADVDGATKRIKVSTRAIRDGAVTKAPRRAHLRKHGAIKVGN